MTTIESAAIDSVEAALDLTVEDRGDLAGLYRFNVERVPLVRMLGVNILIFVAFLHNRLVFGEVDAAVLVPFALALELYVLISWGLLRVFFVRIQRLNLGDVFLALDFLVFDWGIWVTGAEESLIWPIFIVRIADQLWLDKRRGKLMAVLGPVAYGAMLALLLLMGDAVAWGPEITKLAVLVGISIYLIYLSTDGWDQQTRTLEAREWILRLERQSLELQAERLRAEQASTAKSEFVARMSHELRTPLNSVIGFANVLLKNRTSTLSPRELDYLGRIRLNSKHLFNLINDILDLSRVEEGLLTVVSADVDLGSLVREVELELEVQAQTSGVQLNIHEVGEGCLVRADAERLHQVLTNLIANGLKFTEAGSVEVRVVWEREAGTPVAIHVVDTGIGIPEDRLQGIFDPFYQVETSLSRRYTGAGLGLSISRSLCELMGMEITAESVVGEGSRFTIWIPDTLVMGMAAPPNSERVGG